MTSSIFKDCLQNLAEEKIISVLNPDLFLPSSTLYKELIAYIFQYCSDLNLSAKTVYLSKLYLDIVFSKQHFTDYSYLSKVCICSLWMAIKFNEPNDISSCFDAETMCSQSLSSLSVAQLLEIEAKILDLLQSNLNYLTPYDYFQIFSSFYPFLLQAQASLKSIMELSCSICQLRKESSLNIFYGSLMAICNLKNINFQIFTNKLADPNGLELHRIEMISSFIIQRYNQILNEDIEEKQSVLQTQSA